MKVGGWKTADVALRYDLGNLEALHTEHPRDALGYLARANTRSYGNTIVDGDLWDDVKVWGTQASERVYPFMSYFEVLARFRAGLDDSALERRESSP